MKFYLDEDLNPLVAPLLRQHGQDALSSHECGRNGLDDGEQLRLAVQDGRCFVTRNRDDFIRLTVRAFEDQGPHHGVLIVPHSLDNRHVARMAEALTRYVEAHPEGMSPYTVDFLQAP